MKLKEFIKGDISKVEFYAAKRPKYNKEDQAYQFDNDSLVSLNAFDQLNSLNKLFPLIKEQLESTLDEIQVKDYSNTDALEGFLYLDSNVNLDYRERLIEPLCSISLLETAQVNCNYVIIKIIDEQHDEILVWYKLKSVLKIENNLFNYNPNQFQIKLTKDGITFDNYPCIDFDLSLLAFISYNDEFYIFNKELYQKYFNLETYHYHLATNLVYNCDRIISDGELLTKSNAKFVCEYFDNVDFLFSNIEQEIISKESLNQMVYELNLGLSYDLESNKFLLKRPKDLVDLILLSSGCLGINKLTNESFKVKKPNYLAEE